jgi:hypothetical protein
MPLDVKKFIEWPYKYLATMTEQTSGTSQETDCHSKYEANPELWDDVWNKIQRITLKDQYEEKCWVVHVGQTIQTAQYQKIQIEVNKDGYAKINVTFDRLDENRKPVVRTYTHNQTGKQGTRRDTRKESMYIHHLAYLKRTLGTSEYFQRSSMRPESRHTLSHLCNRRGCFKPDHITFEAHLYNLSRGACNAELCKIVLHSPPCLTHTSTVIESVAKLNQRFGYGLNTVNEASEAKSSSSRLPLVSTQTSSSTSSARRDTVVIDDDDFF